MAREAGMDNGIDIKNNDGKVFRNVEDKNGSGNGKAMQSLSLHRSLSEAQGLLKRNRMLLQEIGQNHEARKAGCLNRNTTLIFEIQTTSPGGYKEGAASPLEETD